MQRIALIGAGFMGGQHAANLAAHPDVDLVAVCDADPRRADAVAGRYGARATTDAAEVVAAARVDAVLVASPTDTHAAHLRRAADAGVAVLCEKPIDPSLDTAVDAARYAAARNARVMIGFNRRFDRDHAELKAIVDGGEIGDVSLMQLTSRGPSVPPLEYIAVSGGQMRDQAVHFFDLARWIAGAEPTEVFAAGSALADPRIADHGDVDTSAITLRLETGALVQVDCARRTGYGYDERVEVLGSHGMAESGRHRTSTVVRYVDGAGRTAGMHAGWLERVLPTYAAELDHFVRGLETEEPFGPGLIDGLRAQAIAEAATRSLASGRSEPVDRIDP
ncbi:Gfo/Idh/MocA family oxidoreductase [Tsukamurella sp. 1534]|uniref:Gfo/Idh/MocA family oxidoreductase n=1 Tax=Tsukamurella sp. 1534 TaxID=1151061 RepID=UPI0002EA68CB|nr:Gfo/Idh/MocA family oxidoreductase [Tsukamurella sp. 1534]